MIAVVDAYDAMTNDRSYRTAMPVSRAMKELKRCAGSQFDSFIVSKFLRMLKENQSNVEMAACERKGKRKIRSALHSPPQIKKKSIIVYIRSCIVAIYWMSP